MSAHQFDTSGEVVRAKPLKRSIEPDGSCTYCGRDREGWRRGPCVEDCPSRSYQWSDLTPFEQGYIEAAFADLRERWAAKYAATHGGRVNPDFKHPGFSDLAPETLQRIREDCAAFPCAIHGNDGLAGGYFWNARQKGTWAEIGFPHLTIALNDAGKVVFL